MALAPGAAVLGAALVTVSSPALREPIAEFLAAYPLLLPGAGALLALAYRRRRALYAVLIVGVAAWAAGERESGELARAVAGAAAVLLPTNFLALGGCRERSPFSTAGVVGLAAVAAQPLTVAYAWHAYLPGLLAAPWTPLFPAGWPRLGQLPDAALLAFATAFAALAVRTVRTGDPLDGGLLFALVATLWGLVGGPFRVAHLWLAAAALAVVVSLVLASARWAFLDPLTGVPGRRACDEALAQVGGVYTVALVDIDHFKRINDRYGHAAGDQVLRLVAARLGEVGGAGRAFRWGGEEFVVLFANKTIDGVLPFLEGVHRAIAATPFRLRRSDRPRRRPKQVPARREEPPAVPVTVSMGVAGSGPSSSRPVGEVLRAADAALYRAKAAGRNRIWVDTLVEETQQN